MTAARSLATAVEPAAGPPGAFAAAAEDYWHLGWLPLPLGGADGRKPLIRGFTKYRWRPGLKTIREWFKRRDVTGIGLVTGKLGNLAVLDDDDPAIPLVELKRRCGETPVRVTTPRGGDGGHLYYRYNGERCGNFGAEGLKIDIKGEGGYVVAPPSVRLTGANAGKAYSFAPEVSGGDLARPLPLITPDSLPERTKTAPAAAGKVVQLRAVSEPHRNVALFRAAMRCARSCGSEAALLEAGIEINSHFNPPLERAEVAKTVHSAWGYEERSENWFNRASTGTVSGVPDVAAAISAVRTHPGGEDAAALYPTLEKRGLGGKPFAASPKTLAQWGVIPAWGASYRRYERALAMLVELGFLVIVHKGGRWRGDARKFAFPAMPPRLVVFEKPDDVDLMRAVDALKTGLSIRKASELLGMDRSKALRLKRRAEASGLLKSAVVSTAGVSHQSEPTKKVSKEDSHPTRRPAAPSSLGSEGFLGVQNSDAPPPLQPKPVGAGCLLNLPDGKGGHRLCDEPVGADGIFCLEHARTRDPPSGVMEKTRAAGFPAEFNFVREQR